MAGESAARQVSVTPADEADRTLIEGLFQFYIYDFSELEPAGSDALSFNGEGLFEPYPYLPEYWGAADRWPLLIRVDGQLAGFVLINTLSHMGGAAERNMAEFFVARKYRGGEVAAQALHQVLALHPGRWEVAVVARTARALTFWPRAIAAAPNVSDVQRLDRDDEHWKGPIWTFVAG
ncbi:MAG: GNAT family N-acetyltransferase [Caulobacterales bacterium]|nr:GNAT family N-acetyltransferase [Caulobacterales bacterium]